jgi:hypothetical protein
MYKSLERIINHIGQSDIWEFYYNKEQNGFIAPNRILSNNA